MQETAWEAGVPARTALGELTALPQLMGRGLTAPSARQRWTLIASSHLIFYSLKTVVKLNCVHSSYT